MSSEQRNYVRYFLEDNLGLADGSLDPDWIPSAVVEEVASSVRGIPTGEPSIPFLDQLSLSLLPDIERMEIERRGFFVRKSRWPEGAPYAVCLTHDVDNISRPFSHLWRTRDRFSSADLVKHILGISSIYDNVENIAREEGRRGFHSSFYFLTSTNYPLSKIKKSATRLRGEGWDIGLHGDFGTHDSMEKMAESLKRFSTQLGIVPRGVREHYLKFDFGKTWEIMDASGFEYDTTVGLNDRLGFKLGLATPFHPPDSGWNMLRLLELPLTLMDTTLWGYLKKDESSGMAEIQTMVDKVRGVGGLFTLLWHQEAVKMTGGRLYWRLLDQFRRDNPFIGSGAELADWWVRRSAPLRLEGSTFHFDGNAPAGCCLILKTRKKKEKNNLHRVRVEGGTTTSSLQEAADGSTTTTIINVTGLDMTARVE